MESDPPIEPCSSCEGHWPIPELSQCPDCRIDNLCDDCLHMDCAFHSDKHDHDGSILPSEVLSQRSPKGWDHGGD